MPTKTSDKQALHSSFRDPAGFVFRHEGVLLRQVNHIYKEHYDHLMESGLYKELTDKNLLIAHEEANAQELSPGAYKVIKPVNIPFISYPYEWCFSQYQQAALTTLLIQSIAFKHGMVLKDAGAYNIQFFQGKPVHIDTLSFEKYCPGQPWQAYGQFCRHFLAPLALMCYTDVRLSQLLRVFVDGLPLDLASSLLAKKTWGKLGLLSHIHMHAKSQKRYGRASLKKQPKLSLLGFKALIDNLESVIGKMSWSGIGTNWAGYYGDTNYSKPAHDDKKRIVDNFIIQINPTAVWDLGANTGRFSRIPGNKGIDTVAFDIDPGAVEANWRQCLKDGDRHVLPLVLDLANPSGGIGWAGEERDSLNQRGPVDTIMALALVHHLAISNNVPFSMLAGFFAGLCTSLVIEFVPKEDSKVRHMLATRPDIFIDYTQEKFESEFSRLFEIKDSVKVMETERTIYLMVKK